MAHSISGKPAPGTRLIKWAIPMAFLICAGWTVWHFPAFIIDLIPPQSDSLRAQITELHMRKQVNPGMPGLFGGLSDIIDWIALLALPVLAIIGTRTLVVAPMEYQTAHRHDRFALFIGRVTMLMIIAMTCVMLYEVFLRYVLEQPTKWANELTLWIAGFVFLCSGLYAMQQRSHIRIFILYDMMPRGVQRMFDVISTALIVIFAFFLWFGSYQQVFVNKFYKWEMFGTAFDPPIPATIQPMILIIIALVALQAVANLFADWHATPEQHIDAPDETEIEALKRSAGAE